MRAANLRSSKVTYATSPSRTLRTMKPSSACQIIVAGSMSPAWTEDGLRQARPGSASRALSLAGQSPVLAGWSPVDFSEDGIDRAHDRDDVGHLVAGHDVGQHREV